MENNKEKIILEISAGSGYDPKMIELLYDFTHGDKSGIEKILSSIHKNFMLVKVNFDAKPIEKQGFFYFVYDIAKNDFIERNFFAYKNFTPVDLSLPWEKNREIIYEFKGKDKHDHVLWGMFEKEIRQENFQKELKRIVSDFFASQKFQTLLETLLQKGLTPVFFNKAFTLDVKYEMLDPFIFFSPMEDKKKEARESEKENEPKEEENIIVRLKVKPVLDPLEGIPIKSLSQENPVLFELKDEREAAFYIGELLQKKNSGNAMIGYVKSYSVVDQDTLKLNIFFAPGIWGEALVANTLRVHVVKPEEEVEEEEKKENKKFIKISHKSFIIGITVIIFIILLFLIFTN
ncbi:MAG TPA: hypothetical protein DHW82_07395 [Spirochaetia bacterium]|nr:MAG: hypothetical protein A2Y41_12210 [Spirochaetes bacterium GWB1_36_13]HCL56817.1 hypothetical protein [Spirochaetia bacterium]